MGKEVILSVKNLNVNYRVYEGTMKVIDGLNLTVNMGEKVGLVGETGCGKTSTLKSILRIMPQNCIYSGEIYFEGNDMMKMKSDKMRNMRRRNISMIFQDPTSALNPVFTIRDQLYSVIRNSIPERKARNKREVEKIAEKALKEVYLADPQRVLAGYPFQLSGGMRQRVCIAMALATNKDLLLADEPGTSLDVTIQDQVLRLIDELVAEKGLSVLLVSHSLGVVREMTDRIYVMYGGNMVESGPTKELFKEPLHPYTVALLDCVPKLTGEGIRATISGEMVDYLNPSKGCRFAPRCKKALNICHSTKPIQNTVGSSGHWVACHLYE